MKKIALALLIFFALFLRTYHISQVPPALSWDEVSIGYNAYNILKTARDEHGRFFPIDTFVAYGDYKPPLAIYLTVPSIALFGLSEFGVRFPSAFFGTLTVLMTYFLVKEFFRRTKNQEPITRNLPTIASLLLATNNQQPRTCRYYQRHCWHFPLGTSICPVPDLKQISHCFLLFLGYILFF